VVGSAVGKTRNRRPLVGTNRNRPRSIAPLFNYHYRGFAYMKYVTISVFFLTAVLPVVCLADNNQNGFLVNGGVGQSSIRENLFGNNETAYDANFGYRWGWFGLEAGYVNPGKFTTSVPAVWTTTPPIGSTVGSTTTTGRLNFDARLHGFTAGVDAHYDFAPNWYVSGRAGAFRWNGSEDNYGSGSTVYVYGSGLVFVTNSISKTDWYAGAGFGYDFSNNFGIGIDYDHYRATSSSNFINLTTAIWSVNAEYRF
jgi:OmpA-OmpF porin, OOP family